MRPAIILFAKAPRPGRVKTRLQPQVTSEQAALLHSAFVEDMLDMLLTFDSTADVELHTDISTDAWSRRRVARATQAEGDLGARMLAALDRGLAAGRPRVMIVGSDVPSLPPHHLAEMLGVDADVAIGPSEDGGYYAIACRRTEPGMFGEMEWSAPRTLEQTVRSCVTIGLSVTVCRPWYDIDTPEDLRRLARDQALPGHTRQWFLRHAPELLVPKMKQ